METDYSDFPSRISAWQLEQFIVLTESVSFTEAAAQLGISQPALSLSMTRLEHILGVRLIERGRGTNTHGVELTTAGAVFKDGAVELLTHFKRVIHETRRTQSVLQSHRLAVGFVSSAIDIFNYLLNIHEQWASGTDVLPVHLIWGDEYEALISGRVDLAILEVPPGTEIPGIQLTPLQKTPRSALMRSDSPLAERSDLKQADLVEHALLDPGSTGFEVDTGDFWIAGPWSRVDRRKLQTVGPPLKSVEEMLSWVSGKKGVAIVADSLKGHYSRSGLVYRPITDIPPVDLSLAIREDESRQMVRSISSQLPQLWEAPQ